MKKTYVVQIIIDITIILLGLFNYFFPSVVNINLNMTFYLMLVIYAGLELCEFIFDRTRLEPLYIFCASATAAFSASFLKDFSPNYVISLTLAVWIFMISIIKIMTLDEVFAKKTHLFLIKLTSFSVMILIGILVSVNLYFRISTMNYMLGFIYISYGVLELICDFLTFLDENKKYLEE